MVEASAIPIYHQNYPRVGHAPIAYESRPRWLGWGTNAIKDIELSQEGIDAIRITWSWYLPARTRSCWLSVYVNGVYYASSMSEEIFVGGLEAGFHQFDLILEPDFLLGKWIVGETDLVGGRRPKLTWSGLTAVQDIAQFNVYKDADFTATWAIVNDIEPTHLEDTAPTGTGTALATTEGDYSGDYVYVEYQIEIDKGGDFDSLGDGATFKHRRRYWDNKLGALQTETYTTGVKLLEVGEVHDLGDGIGVSFGEGNFVLADTWSMTVRCRQYYQHQSELDDGSYTFTVRSQDKAGNEGWIDHAQASITVNGPPSDPTGLDYIYSAADRKLTITGTAPNESDVDKILICSNGGIDADEMPDRRLLHSGWGDGFHLGTQPSSAISVTQGANFSYTTGILKAGIWRFCCMTQDTATLLSPGDEILEIELISDPPREVVYCDAPDSLKATQKADGVVSLEFLLYGTSEDSERCESANVYHNAGSGDVDYTTVIANIVNPQSSNWNKITIDLQGLTGGSTYKFGVRAKSRTGDEETNTTIVTAVADATAPKDPDLVTVQLI